MQVLLTMSQFPPLLNKNRAVDIIIALDASQNVHQGEGAGELRKAEKHVREMGWPFPRSIILILQKKL